MTRAHLIVQNEEPAVTNYKKNGKGRERKIMLSVRAYCSRSGRA